MSNNIIPSFLSPSYDFIEEENEEEEEEEGSLVCNIIYGAVLGFALFILIDSDIDVSFKFSFNRKRVLNCKNNLSKTKDNLKSLTSKSKIT